MVPCLKFAGRCFMGGKILAQDFFGFYAEN